MFRQGSKNGHTVYWTDPDSPNDRFVCTAMTPDAALYIVDALNESPVSPGFLAGLPAIPKRDPAP